jgi:glycosyltransferase involved in cell wall biosynthesis
MISRLADQKGFDLLAEILEELFTLDLGFVLLGTGEQKYHDLFQQVARKYPQKAGIRIAYDDRLAHKIEAGADFFLMPSKYEPCGLNQIYSLKYGTIPVVRATGGLDDTIVNYDPVTGTGNGFKFSRYDAGIPEPDQSGDQLFLAAEALETTPSECDDGGFLLAKVGRSLPSALSEGFKKEKSILVGYRKRVYDDEIHRSFSDRRGPRLSFSAFSYDRR